MMEYLTQFSMQSHRVSNHPLHRTRLEEDLLVHAVLQQQQRLQQLVVHILCHQRMQYNHLKQIHQLPNIPTIISIQLSPLLLLHKQLHQQQVMTTKIDQ